MLFCLSNRSPYNSWAAAVFRQSCYGLLVVHHCPQECALQNPPTEMMPQWFACVLFCNPQYRKKAFKKPLERHRHSTTVVCEYFITITTGFQQKIALKQSRGLSVAQTAAKRTIRTDLPFARQQKRSAGSFADQGWGMGISQLTAFCGIHGGQFYFCRKLYSHALITSASSCMINTECRKGEPRGVRHVLLSIVFQVCLFSGFRFFKYYG